MTAGAVGVAGAAVGAAAAAGSERAVAADPPNGSHAHHLCS